ncbi:beta-defensin 125 [Sciurus carolinensis]|uniref:beta-defensin 125 n=1 Tax=Sciurus carolinensis TaxID=30640 RepID=UPI001FB28507|nr:beta-defensin 125 [Sciurus carolinensis]
MRFLMPTLVLCGLLTQVTKAGWSQPRCWKNNIGYCRRRCLDDERYILLCKNKVSCCIPIVLPPEFTRKTPPPLVHIEDITPDLSDLDSSPGSPVTKLSDQITFDDSLFLKTEKLKAPEKPVTQFMTTPMRLPHAAVN